MLTIVTHFFCHLKEAFHVLYKVKLYDKCEIKLKDWCLNIDHLFPVQEDEHMYIWRNIAWQIYSVVMHDLTVDMHTFLTLPLQMLWHK